MDLCEDNGASFQELHIGVYLDDEREVRTKGQLRRNLYSHQARLKDKQNHNIISQSWQAKKARLMIPAKMND